MLKKILYIVIGSIAISILFVHPFFKPDFSNDYLTIMTEKLRTEKKQAYANIKQLNKQHRMGVISHENFGEKFLKLEKRFLSKNNEYKDSYHDLMAHYDTYRVFGYKNKYTFMYNFGLTFFALIIACLYLRQTLTIVCDKKENLYRLYFARLFLLAVGIQIIHTFTANNLFIGDFPKWIYAIMTVTFSIFGIFCFERIAHAENRYIKQLKKTVNNLFGFLNHIQQNGYIRDNMTNEFKNKLRSEELIPETMQEDYMNMIQEMALEKMKELELEKI